MRKKITKYDSKDYHKENLNADNIRLMMMIMKMSKVNEQKNNDNLVKFYILTKIFL